MKRILLCSLLAIAATTLSTCGEDLGGLYGGQCDLIDCHYDTIECQLYAPPNHEIVVHYLKQPDQIREWTARIAISLEGIEKVSGLRLEEQDFLGRVFLTRPPGTGEQWPEYNGRFCEIRSGGDQAGGNLSGKCSFSFTNGHFLTTDFSCELEAVE